MNDYKPKISIVVATKNEEANIERCIRSVQEQDYSRDLIEIILVDNNSSDSTIEIAKKYISNIYTLTKVTDISQVKNFRGAQVNAGVEKAKGDIIFFPDADMTFHPKLFAEAAELLQNNDALFVPETVCGKGLFGKIRNFERSFYNNTCIDGVRFVKKQVFTDIGGYDTKNIMFGPDDWDITKTLKSKGYKLGITEHTLYHHEEWLTLYKYVSKKGKYVKTFEGYIAKWGKNDPDIAKQFGFIYRYFGVFVENGKWKKLLRRPILACGMYFIRFLVGVTYLFSVR